jgi:hypothetical protein
VVPAYQLTSPSSLPFATTPKTTLAEQEGRLHGILRTSVDANAVAAQVTRSDFVEILQQLAEAAKTDPGAAVRAERWLVRMERLAEALLEESREEEEDASTRSSLTHHLPHRHQPPPPHWARLVPDTECYRHVIQAWANSPYEKASLAVTRARRWLVKHVGDETDKDNRHASLPSQRPDTATYNAFLDAVSRGRARKENPHPDQILDAHARLAQDTLDAMIQEGYRVVARQPPPPPQSHGMDLSAHALPDIDSFNFVLRAWTRCIRRQQVADRVMDVMNSLEKYQTEVDPSVRLNIKSYGLLLDSLRCSVADKVQRCNNPSDDAANGLEEIQQMMDIVHLMTQDGRPEVAPTTYIYNILISTWAHLARIHPTTAPLAAERLLQQLTRSADQDPDCSLRPDATSYLTVLRVWRNSAHPQRAQRVVWWLQTQWKDTELIERLEGPAAADAVRPTTEVYNMVLRTLADTGQASLAETYFAEMANDDKNIPRNSESFAFLIQAWIGVAKQRGDFTALQKAHRLLQEAARLEARGEPTVQTRRQMYGEILQVAQSVVSRHPVEALALAKNVFVEMQESHHSVEHFEYTKLVRVGLLALSRPEQVAERTEFLHTIVDQCAQAGLVSGPFVRAIAKGTVHYDGWTVEESERFSQEAFPLPLPPSWTRNISKPDYLPKRRDLKRTHFDGFAPHHHSNPATRGNGARYKPKIRNSAAFPRREREDSLPVVSRQ